MFNVIADHSVNDDLKKQIKEFQLTPEKMAEYLPDFASRAFKVPVIDNVATSWIFKYWDMERNGRLSAMNVPLSNSGISVWWKCPGGKGFFYWVDHVTFFNDEGFDGAKKDIRNCICPLYGAFEYEYTQQCFGCEYINDRLDSFIVDYINGKERQKFCSSSIHEYLADNEKVLMYLITCRLEKNPQITRRFNELVFDKFSITGNRGFLSGKEIQVHTLPMLNLVLKLIPFYNNSVITINITGFKPDNIPKSKILKIQKNSRSIFRINSGEQ